MKFRDDYWELLKHSVETTAKAFNKGDETQTAKGLVSLIGVVNLVERNRHDHCQGTLIDEELISPHLLMPSKEKR